MKDFKPTAYNQDRIIQHKHIIRYISQVLKRGLQHHGVANYYKPGLESSESIIYTLSSSTIASLTDHISHKSIKESKLKDDHVQVI
jgi:hypothetical protein